MASFISLAATLLFAGIRVAFVGDPQVDNQTELRYAQKSIYRELRERKDIDLVVILGDLVNDKVELLEPSRASLDSIGVKWVCTNGNHDKDVYRDARGKMYDARDCATFSRVIHAPDTTFVMGGVRFILMDDVRISGMASYEGGLRDSQWKWLSGVVAEANEPVIFCSHIPVWEFSEAAQDTLQRVMAPVKVQYVCGHTHTVRRAKLGASDVLDVGATCGTWWRGVKDADGIPWAIMNCGAPRGYFVADITPSEGIKRLSFKAVRRPEDFQLSAHISADGTLRANVFGGAEGGTLQVRRGLRWLTLTQVAEMAPELALLKEQTRQLSREYRRDHKDEIIPVLSSPSPHVWSLPAGVLALPSAGPASSVSSPRPAGPASSASGRRLRFRYRDPYMTFKVTVSPIFD